MNCRDAIFPSLHHRKEGWPSELIRVAKPPLTRVRGGFPNEKQKRKTTFTASRYRARASRPAASASVAAQNCFDDAALPSLRLCKEGNMLDSNSFTPSMTPRRTHEDCNREPRDDRHG